jgi:hypothetical protein
MAAPSIQELKDQFQSKTQMNADEHPADFSAWLTILLLEKFEVATSECKHHDPNQSISWGQTAEILDIIKV